MPWLSIIMAIISAIASLKSKPNDKGRAVAAAALAGMGTYYVTHNTEWGRENLGKLDGVVTVPPVPAGDTPATLPDGSKTGTLVTPMPTTTNGTQTGVWDVMKDWGPTGVASVIGTTAVATGRFDKYLPWIVVGLGVLLIVR